MKFTLNIFAVAVAHFLFTGTEISSVEGLSCPICFKLGQFGNFDCQMMDCNDARDIDLSEEAIRALMSQTLDEVRNWTTRQGFTLAGTVWDDLGAPWRSNDPVCVKIAGSFGPQLNIPYFEASCRSRESPEINLFDREITTNTPCLVMANKNITDSTGHPMTLDRFCVCDKKEHQEECSASYEDRRKHFGGTAKQEDPSKSKSHLSDVALIIRAPFILMLGLVGHLFLVVV